VAVTFDPDRDAANRAKHGVSLALAEAMVIEAFIVDDRADYGEVRYRADQVRAISLRRSHLKEYRRHVR